MKTSSIFCAAFAALAVKFSVVSGTAAPAPSTAISSNAIPKSVFTIPTSKKDGCDPFFPNSPRPWGGSSSVQSAKVPNKPTGADCLVLKGLSGAQGSPLAMINGRTMARGEDAEINTDCGRILVHCVEITTNSAIVEVSGERRELHLRQDL